MEIIFHSYAIKLIFKRKVVHLASFWKWGCLELGSGLFMGRDKLDTSNLIDSNVDLFMYLIEGIRYMKRSKFNLGLNNVIRT